jgi:thiol-disulfide isomerase/thioredoxin
MRNFSASPTVKLVLAALVLAVAPSRLVAAPELATDALLSHTLQAKEPDAAWTELQKSQRRPPTPAEWRTKSPTQEEQEKFLVPYVLAVEDRAKAFYTAFPSDSHALEAKLQEFEFASLALQMGAKDQQTRMDALEKLLLADPGLSNQQRFSLRQSDVERAAKAKESEGEAAALAEFEKGARALQKEFPKEPGAQKMLLEAAAGNAPEKARVILQELAANPVSEEIRQAAADQLKKLDAVGKPVELQFTAVDGREVDVSKLKGKVVMLDFWATWCPPCVAEVPHVVETYNKLHDKGFEIIGVSLDKEKSSLTQYVAEHKMTWPQFFDGQYWQNKYARQFGIDSIPAMWLIDKQGHLRDMNGRADLSGKVEKLLAE